MLDATVLLRLYARWRRARLNRQDPQAAQRDTLQRLVGRAAATSFGRDHGFARISTLEDFQKAVPLRRFEDFWRDYWAVGFPRVTDASWPGTVPYFAKTSGTTSGTSKYIPVTREILKGNQRAVLDLLCFHVEAKPDSRVLGGRTFMLGGSTALEEPTAGVFAGDMSGVSAREVPPWARLFYYPPPEVAEMSDWERKMALLAEDAPKRDIRLVGGTTSWLLLFLQDLAARSGGLAAAFPKLELVVYGGVAFAPYRAQYEALLGGRGIDFREVYPASEGFLAVADRGVGEGLRLQADGGLFFEFVPVEELESRNPRRFWLGTVETDVNYAVALSTPAGAFAYILGDTVRFLSTDPPRILITGRTSTSLSAFGEHLIEEEIQRAVSEASASQGLSVADFSVGPVYPTGEERCGHHLYVVEFDGGPVAPERLKAFSQRVDEVLCRINDDYRDHREGDIQMKGPEVLAAPHGSFFNWMKARGKLGGQNKVPRVITDPDLLSSLVEASRG